MQNIGTQYIIVEDGERIEAKVFSEDYATGHIKQNGQRREVSFEKNVAPGLFPVPAGESIHRRSIWRIEQ
jgi:hypothetical protein